jgi:hypothetical protein
MSTRQQQRDRDALTRAIAGEPLTGSQQLAERAERLLRAGEDIIGRALSANSEQFLAENRQQGGQ